VEKNQNHCNLINSAIDVDTNMDMDMNMDLEMETEMNMEIDTDMDKAMESNNLNGHSTENYER
jgi:hypothetical protein